MAQLPGVNLAISLSRTVVPRPSTFTTSVARRIIARPIDAMTSQRARVPAVLEQESAFMCSVLPSRTLLFSSQWRFEQSPHCQQTVWFCHENRVWKGTKRGHRKWKISPVFWDFNPPKYPAPNKKLCRKIGKVNLHGESCYKSSLNVLKSKP